MILEIAFNAEGAEKSQGNAKAYANETAHPEGETDFSPASSAALRFLR